MSNNKSNKKNCRISGNELAVGGQAVLEGVMMRGKDKFAVSVRSPTGKIESMVQDIPTKTKFQKVIRKMIFIRGVFALFDSLKIGFKALDFSADVAIDGEEELENKKKGLKSNKSEKNMNKKGDSKMDSLFMGITMVSSLLFAIFLFKFLPFYLSGLIVGKGASSFVWIEGLIKMSIFIGYLLVISLSKQIRRVFAYHGAEHKSVHCYEKYGLSDKLTAENAMKFSRIHKRCGTTFMFLVIFISIIIYSIIPINFGFWFSFVVRLLFLPVIAGIGFEVLQIVPKLSSKNPLKWILMTIEYPGLFLQYVTTREPDIEQLEVAIESLKKVV